MKTLKIGSWVTASTTYPQQTIGSASITKTRCARGGIYLMEGVDGWELYKLTKPIIVTQLKINGKGVMIDDPLHWLGMKRLAEHCRGRVLIGGLGLGLILHHLKDNKAVAKIDVVERNLDVITLIKPLLPEDKRVTIHHSDVFGDEWVHGDYDTIVLDLWVKKGKNLSVAGTNEHTGITRTYLRFSANNPQAEVYIWGHRDPEINPAVGQVSEIYLRFCEELSKYIPNKQQRVEKING